MDISKRLEEEKDQQLRIQCIECASRTIGLPRHINLENDGEDQHEDVVDLANRIYEFVTSK